MIEVTVNQEPVRVEPTTNLLGLLEALHFSDKKGIAVALNNQVISRTHWPQTPLSPQDQIIIITATAGG